ncbi:MAG: tryptophan--tRNA ligase [Bdellovibrionales bacterium]|nr:tryptophan--tRNA ligase [Bdellovibrionales bacterium]
MAEKKRELVLSGVQPSAAQVHLGNYLGAMKRFVTLSQQYDTIVCIVDLHALTTVWDAQALRENTVSLAAAYLAIGMEPSRAIIFRQSDVAEVCELTWYLACQFPLGLLERATSLKDAKAKAKVVNSGLMYYPVLMAADILLYRSTKVPVGADQKQHLEMTREVAQKFNNAYGDVFPLPEPLIEEDTGVIVGLDGRKMSKSYDNYIGLFEDSKKVRKKVMKIVTDSKSVEDEKDPDTCNVFTLYKFFASQQEQAALAEKYRAGGMGYGEAKQALFESIEREISPMRDKYNDLMSRPDDLRDVLADGARRAREIAGVTMASVREAVGVGSIL